MKLPKNEHRIWQLSQIRNFVDKIISSVGGRSGWEYLSYGMKSALVSQEVLWIIRSTARDNVMPIVSVDCLYMDMMRVADLITDEE